VTAIYGLYPDGDRAQRAVNALRTAGVADADITVISAEPMEHYEFGELGKGSAMWTIASIGGLAGMLVGVWLTRLTEVAWPLNTGNMPIVAWWPNLIIIFELTMLGAIFSTVVTVVVASGLLRSRPALYDPAVSDGQILVGVESPADALAIEKALAIDGTTIRRAGLNT
jgi:Alternative complex III, ActD subunit